MTSPQTPLVSIIVPAFDAAAQIGAAIASLRAQTLTDFEALLIDDGSTDDSAAAIEAAIAGDARLRLIRQPNGGVSAARNAGLDAAQGEFVAFLDGGDAYEPDFLERLHAAILREGTGWAASGYWLVHADGSEPPHPAIHACPEPGPARVLALDDACEAVRVVPAVWNKLCRRDLFASLRFPEGICFGEHEVFWSLVARAPRLACLPEPLYRRRRDRPGQIGDSDSDRVFDQLRVLDRLYPLIAPLPQGEAAYARLATRLVHERAQGLRDRARRAQFLAATLALFERLGVHWTPGGDPEISRALGHALAGRLALSVVVLDAEPAAALAALEAQDMADMEIVVPVAARVEDRLPSGVELRRLDAAGMTPAALAAALAGEWVLLLAPGERPAPCGLMRLVNLGESSAAGVAMGGMERATRGYHDGFTDNTLLDADLSALPAAGDRIPLAPRGALRLYPALGNRVIRRDVLGALPEGLRIAGDAVAVQVLAMATAMAGEGFGYTRLAVARVPDRPARIPGPFAAQRAVEALPPPGAGLPEGWRGTLFFRFLRLRRGWGGLRWPLAVVLALSSGHLPASPEARPDPDSPAMVRRLADWLRWRP